MAPQTSLVPGMMLGGRYVVDALAHTGNTAEVWTGTDVLLDRAISVKTLRPEAARHPAAVEQFEIEAQAAARVHHRSIVEIYDTVDVRGQAAIVMEFIEGRSLREILDHHGTVTVRDALKIGVDLCEALAVLHETFIVHCDLKPANVIIGNRNRVVLADFGSAIQLNKRSRGRRGRSATYRYAAPELLANRLIDRRADVYSLGVLLYELLSGRRPFEDRDDRTSALTRLNRRAPQLGALAPDVPEAVRVTIMRCLEREPDQRFDDTTQLALALQAAGAEPDVVPGQMAPSAAVQNPTVMNPPTNPTVPISRPLPGPPPVTSPPPVAAPPPTGTPQSAPAPVPAPQPAPAPVAAPKSAPPSAPVPQVPADGPPARSEPRRSAIPDWVAGARGPLRPHSAEAALRPPDDPSPSNHAPHPDADHLAAEQAEADRLAGEQAAAEQRAAEHRAAQHRAAQQRADEQAAIAAQQAAEQAAADRLAAEQAAAQQAAREAAEQQAAAQAEADRLAAAQAEAERRAAEQAAAAQATAERLAAAQAEADRLAAEQAAAQRAAAQAEADRIAAEQRAAEQAAAEQAAAEQRAADEHAVEQAAAQRAAAQRAAEHAATEQQAAADRLAAERAKLETPLAQVISAQSASESRSERAGAIAPFASAADIAADESQAGAPSFTATARVGGEFDLDVPVGAVGQADGAPAGPEVTGGVPLDIPPPFDPFAWRRAIDEPEDDEPADPFAWRSNLAELDQSAAEAQALEPAEASQGTAFQRSFGQPSPVRATPPDEGQGWNDIKLPLPQVPPALASYQRAADALEPVGAHAPSTVADRPARQGRPMPDPASDGPGLDDDPRFSPVPDAQAPPGFARPTLPGGEVPDGTSGATDGPPRIGGVVALLAFCLVGVLVWIGVNDNAADSDRDPVETMLPQASDATIPQSDTAQLDDTAPLDDTAQLDDTALPGDTAPRSETPAMDDTADNTTAETDGTDSASPDSAAADGATSGQDAEGDSDNGEPNLRAAEIALVRSFDPYGDGVEHDAELANLTDGDLETTWSSEVYGGPLGTAKPGLGIALQITGGQPPEALVISAAQAGWSANVYASETSHEDLDAWGEPIASIAVSDVGQTTIDLPDLLAGEADGTHVLVWFTSVPQSIASTELFGGGPGYQLKLGEVSLLGGGASPGTADAT